MMQPNDGVTCIEYKSVLFGINTLVRHLIENPTHNYFKYGNAELVLFTKLLLPADDVDGK